MARSLDSSAGWEQHDGHLRSGGHGRRVPRPARDDRGARERPHDSRSRAVPRRAGGHRHRERPRVRGQARRGPRASGGRRCGARPRALERRPRARRSGFRLCHPRHSSAFADDPARAPAEDPRPYRNGAFLPALPGTDRRGHGYEGQDDDDDAHRARALVRPASSGRRREHRHRRAAAPRGLVDAE